MSATAMWIPPSVSEEFDLMVVVTHVPEVVDRIPVKFRVSMAEEETAHGELTV